MDLKIAHTENPSTYPEFIRIWEKIVHTWVSKVLVIPRWRQPS